MARKWYAGYNSYGTSFTYDSDGWGVHVFGSKVARDGWVSADDYNGGSNPTRETITLKIAKRIQSDESEWVQHS